jgi:serine/threonine protein kinase
VSSSIETRLSGRYILQQKLGQGGMGAVYRALDRLTQETVALKRVTMPTEQFEFASRASMGQGGNFRLAVAREHFAGKNQDIYGTPAYLAPEVLEGQPASAASDLYAVGLIAYELFAGRHPFNTTIISDCRT